MKKTTMTLGLSVLLFAANAQQTFKIKNPIKSNISKALTTKGKKIKTENAANAAKTINQTASTMSTTPIWSDDFSSAATWTVSHTTPSTSVTPGAPDWTIGTTGGVGTYSLGPFASTTAANGFATFDSDTDCSGDEIANITTVNPINLTGHPSVSLQFQQLYGRYYDSTRLYISTNGTTWTNFPINEQYVNANTAAQISPNPETVYVNISSVAGNQATVWVRFTYYSPASVYGGNAGCGYNWLIDDVSISDLPANDMTALDAFSGTACGLNYGVVGMDIKNSGANAATNFPIAYKVNGGTPVIETYTGTVASGASATYYFNTPVTGVAANTTYSIVAYVDIASDGYLADDTTKTGFVGAPYNTTYNSGFENLPYKDLSGWSAQDVDASGSTWGVDTQVPFTGTNEMLVFENGAGTGDNWLFSPCLNLVANGIYTVKYHVEVPNLSSSSLATAGSLGVFLGDTAAASRMTMTISPTTAIDTSATSASGYSLVTTTFTNTTAGVYVVGFEATNTDASATLVMLLDGFTIQKTGTAAGIQTFINNADLSMYPNPTNGILNITTTASKATVEIFNVMGQNVATKEITNGTNSIDISNLSNGVYSVQITQNNTVTVGKVIKTN